MESTYILNILKKGYRHIANVFPILQTIKHLVKPLSKNHS